MQATDLDRGGNHEPSFGPRAIVTPEEYGALMAGLAKMEFEREYVPKIMAAEAQMKRIEFLLITQLIILMAVFLFFRAG